MRRAAIRRDRSRPSSMFSEIAKQYPLLTEDDFLLLFRAYKEGSRAAGDRIVLSNVRLVMRYARRFSNRGIAFDDLVQEGLLILREKCLPKFDPSQNAGWATYAGYWIRHAMQRTIGDHRTDVVSRIPIHVSEQRARVVVVREAYYRQFGEYLEGERLAEEVRKVVEKQTERRFTREHRRPPTKKELTALLERSSRYQISAAQVDRIIAVNARLMSLDAPIRDGGTIADYTADASRPEQRMELGASLGDIERASECVMDAVNALPEREREIISRRFGLDGNDPQRLRDIGEAIGLSYERVRQLESRVVRDIGRAIHREWEFVVMSLQSIGDRAEFRGGRRPSQPPPNEDELHMLFEALCQHAVPTHGGAWCVVRPVQTIASRTCLEHRAAEAVIKQMENAGWLNWMDGVDAVLLLRHDALAYARQRQKHEFKGVQKDVSIPDRFRRRGRLRKHVSVL